MMLMHRASIRLKLEVRNQRGFGGPLVTLGPRPKSPVPGDGTPPPIFGRQESTMDLQLWLNTTQTGEFVFTALVSMLPVVELRGGIPFGVAAGLSLPLAVLAAVIGNMLPIPFLILFTRRVFQWLRRNVPVLGKLISKLEQRAADKKELVLKYKFWGLLILVAIPLPGTGAWTGALVATVMDLRLKSALPAIFCGVLIAAAIVAMVTMGVIAL